MTKEDLHEIRQIVREEISPLKQQVDQNHREMLVRFDQFKQMESEDVTAVQGDVEDLKLRVTKLEAGRA